MKDLKSIAKDVFSRCLNDAWQPTTRDIEDEYSLNEDQSQRVKRYCRKQGSEVGILWDLYPATMRYRVVSDDGNSFARDMLRYRWESWRDAGRSVRYDMHAASQQGFIDPRDADSAEAWTEEFDSRTNGFMRRFGLAA